MSDPFWLEFRVGLWWLAKCALLTAIVLALLIGGLWLYTKYEIARTVFWWIVWIVIALVLGLIAVAPERPSWRGDGENEMRTYRPPLDGTPYWVWYDRYWGAWMSWYTEKLPESLRSKALRVREWRGD